MDLRMSDLPFTPRPDLLRRAAVTLAALAVYRLGSWIPLPGIDAAGLAAGLGLGSPTEAIARVSVMALGVTPWLSVLLLVELAMIAAPRLRRWAAADANRINLDGWIVLGTLAIAAFQANNIAVILEEISALVPAPGLGFRAGVVASMVAATALLIWIGGLVTRFGLGSGFLLLLAAPPLTELAETLMAAVRAGGTADPLALPLTLALLAAAAAALAAIARNAPRLVTNGQLLWPPIMAYWVGAWLVVITVFSVAPQYFTAVAEMLKPGEPLTIVLFATLTFALFMGRARSLAIANGTSTEEARWSEALVLAGLVAAFETLPTVLSTPPALDGRSALIVVVFALSLLASVRSPGSEPQHTA